MINKNILKLLLVLIGCSQLTFTSCSDENFDPSIFKEVEGLDPNSQTYEFDKWLQGSFLKPYNLKFVYRMEDITSDNEYNLVPARFDKSVKMAKLIDYLWFGVYNEVAGSNFLKKNGPRIIQLIGSAAYNPSSSTKLQGTAESGITVTLYECNSVNEKDIASLNRLYFRTMHHEFAHILHQKKRYSTSFKNITKEYYSPLDWNYKKETEARQKGFVSPYAMSSPDEDFVETIAHYLLASDQAWKELLDSAKSPSNTTDDDDYKDGRYALRLKLNTCSAWLKSAWNIDIEELRSEIQYRQAHIGELFED